MRVSILTKIGALFLFLVIICGFGLYYLNRIKTTPFFVDEYLFIKKGYYFDLFFVKRNIKDPRFIFQDEPLQPKVGPYIYGGALHLYGADDVDSFLSKIYFSKSDNPKNNWWIKLWGKKLSDFPSDMKPIVEVITYERVVSTIFALSFLGILFVLTKRIAGILLATLGTYLVGTNSLVIENSTLATTDSFLMFFSFLSLLLTHALLGRLNIKLNAKTVLISGALGMSIGLGVGVKISGILILMFILCFYGVYMFAFKTRKTYKTIIASATVTIACVFATFIFLHPYLYEDTLIRFPELFIGRLEGASLAQLQFPGSSVQNRSEALRLVVNNTLLPGGFYLNFGKTNYPLDVVFFITGFLLVLTKSIQIYKKNEEVAGETILIIWFLVMFFGLVMYLKNDWSRYYLETVIIITIFESYALAYMADKYVKLVKRQITIFKRH